MCGETPGRTWHRRAGQGSMPRDSQASTSHPLPDAISLKQDSWCLNVGEPFHPPPLSFQKLPSFLPSTDLPGKGRKPLLEGQGDPWEHPAPTLPNPSELGREDPGLLRLCRLRQPCRGSVEGWVGVSECEGRQGLPAGCLLNCCPFNSGRVPWG